MKIKKGDKVIVVSGKDKGKSGVVAYSFPKEDKIIIEGINLKKKHMRARRAGQKGQVIEKPMPIHVSNVMISDPKTGKGARVSISRESGKRIRISKKSKTSID